MAGRGGSHKRLLTPAVTAEIVRLAATLGTGQEIADAIEAKMGIRLVGRTVTKVLQRTRGERADITKNVVREAIKKTVLSDLDLLSKERHRLELIADYFDAEFHKEAKKIRSARDEGLIRQHAIQHRHTVAAIRDLVDTRLH